MESPVPDQEFFQGLIVATRLVYGDAQTKYVELALGGITPADGSDPPPAFTTTMAVTKV